MMRENYPQRQVQPVLIRSTHLPETYANFQAGREIPPWFSMVATPVFFHEFGRKWCISLGGCNNRISTVQPTKLQAILALAGSFKQS
jgi:hypothetical protein